LITAESNSKASSSQKSPKPRKSKKKRSSKKATADLIIPSPVLDESHTGSDGVSPRRHSGKTRSSQVSKNASLEEEKKDAADTVEPDSKVTLDRASTVGEANVKMMDMQIMHSNASASSLSLAGEDDLERQEIIRLQNQLSDALQKIVVTTEEQIQDKDEILRVSNELSKAAADKESMETEIRTLRNKLKERETVVESSMQRIDKLEQAIERQLDAQEALEVKLERSEDEIEKLLIEIQDLEAEAGGNSANGDATLRTELKEAKKELIDKQREIDDQKSKIERLAASMSEGEGEARMEELGSENRALQGKLKGERLDFSSKLAKKDEAIANLQKELSRFEKDIDAQELLAAREEAAKAREDAETSKADMESAVFTATQLKEEKEDLVEKNAGLQEKIRQLQRDTNDLTEKSKELGEKVLQWTEKTYDWKNRAENAEKRLEVQTADRASDNDSEPEELVDEAPQGLFLQAVMDRQVPQGKKPRWSRMFRAGGNSSDGEEITPEEIRIKNLEERNDNLDETITELRSEIVKMQTSHREELFTSQKKIAQLQGENEALSLKNTALEGVCGAHEKSDDVI